MHLKLARTRVVESGNAQLGTLDEFISLERLDRLIPKGVYTITLYDSPKRGLVPLLCDVPDRTFIEIHPANYAHELEGCIAPGTSSNPNGSVNDSREAFSVLLGRIIASLDREEEVTIEVS